MERLLGRTVREDLPREVDYLERYDEFSARLQEEIADMPDGTIDLLTAPAVERVEALYAKCFADTEFR